MDTMTLLLGVLLLFWIFAQISFYLGHSDEHKRALRIQVLCGLPILTYCSWIYCISDWSNLGALYAFGCYCGLCMVYNGFHNLMNRNGWSGDFSEYVLFGFFKTDNFCNEMLLGAVLSYFCFQGFITNNTNSIAMYKNTEAAKPAAHQAHAHTHVPAPAHVSSHGHVSAHAPVHAATHALVHAASVHH